MNKQRLIAWVRDNQRLYEDEHTDAFDKLIETFFLTYRNAAGTSKHVSLYDFVDTEDNRSRLFETVRKMIGARTYKLLSFEFDSFNGVKIRLHV